MKLSDLDAKMRALEAADDPRVPPGVFMVARLDGRGFSRLTRDVLALDDPYDARLSDHMVEATRELMRSGFHVVYGYTQGDEISLLFHPDISDFGRRVGKYLSVLAGTASAAFSLRLGTIACFDCRISQLPDPNSVVDYFVWRVRDAQRNALSTRCICALRDAGLDAKAISSALHGMTTKAKKKMLTRDHGIDFANLPDWCKHGVSLYWERYKKELANADTGQSKTVHRQRIVADRELPGTRRYVQFLHDLVRASFASEAAEAIESNYEVSL